MPAILVEVTCTRGHRRVLRLANYSRQEAELFAGLLDGTSPAYQYPSDDDSPIGKCASCGAKLVARVSEPGLEILHPEP
jgi:hypothetical protein